MDFIFKLDKEIFLAINHLPHEEPFNTIGLAISGLGTLGFIWFIMGLFIFLKEEKKHHWFWAPLFMGGLGSWALVELFLKNFIARQRPTEEIGAIIIGSGDGFSFPSGHSTIAFAMATILSAKEPKLKWVWYFLAVAIGFSRIYLGKHYPLDVLGGAFFGWIIGILAVNLTKLWHNFHP